MWSHAARERVHDSILANAESLNASSSPRMNSDELTENLTNAGVISLSPFSSLIRFFLRLAAVIFSDNNLFACFFQ
jgi:hypothetical protein